MLYARASSPAAACVFECFRKPDRAVIAMGPRNHYNIIYVYSPGGEVCTCKYRIVPTPFGLISKIGENTVYKNNMLRT